jgi:subtilisin family serine protease
MVYQRIAAFLITCVLLCFSPIGLSQISGLGLSLFLEQEDVDLFPTALPYSEKNLELIASEGIRPKYITPEWIYFNVNRSWLIKNRDNQSFRDLYVEYAPPVLLDDTARATHFADAAHVGAGLLPRGYTGKDVIVGVVDAGLDHNHPDFIKASGEKRLLRYWDHGVTSPTQTPQPFNYGQIWYKNDIDNGTITSIETTVGHGSTVTGIAVGNGNANGTNKGFAPEADIIVVRSNFNLPNWTLTIADACSYIFAVADSLGKPAVVNLSLGTYLGSHDGTDPASVLMGGLLDAKPGRIIVCAAGNGGNVPWFHAQNNVTSDVSFIWFKNNPTGSLGNNTVFFDVWSDAIQANFSYAFGANLPSGSFSERGTTIFRNTFTGVGTEIKDTIFNSSGQRIATLRIFPKVVGSNYHLQVLFNQVDSTAYNFSFKTSGSGKYDLWSGAFIGFNNIVQLVPDSSFFPAIVNYVFPDSLQSIVSSWNCSDKVISVGNLRGRASHIDRNFNQYMPSDQTPPGRISPTSSRGPSRHGLIKPDISSSGDVTLAAGPATMLNNPGFFPSIDSGGFHLRNGGTSMASPTVAGTAALFLEQCQKARWSDFKSTLLATCFSDGFTGITPNLSYGHGKLNTHAVLLNHVVPLSIYGDPLICQTPQLFNASASLNTYLWSNGETTSSVTISTPQILSLIGSNELGCEAFSDTVQLIQGMVPASPIITQMGTSLVSSTGPNYQWYRNDILLPGETNQVIFPQSVGFYSVVFTSPDGCNAFSNAFEWTLSISEETASSLSVYPNPVRTWLTIQGESPIQAITILDLNGKSIITQKEIQSNEHTVSVEKLAKGTYFIKIESNSGVVHHKFIKQ